MGRHPPGFNTPLPICWGTRLSGSNWCQGHHGWTAQSRPQQPCRLRCSRQRLSNTTPAALIETGKLTWSHACYKRSTSTVRCRFPRVRCVVIRQTFAPSSSTSWQTVYYHPLPLVHQTCSLPRTTDALFRIHSARAPPLANISSSKASFL